MLQKVGSLQAKLKRETTQKLEAKTISIGQAMELAEVRGNL